MLSNEDAKEKWLKRNAFERARLCRALAIAHTKYTTIQCLTMTSIQKNFNSFPMGTNTCKSGDKQRKTFRSFSLQLLKNDLSSSGEEHRHSRTCTQSPTLIPLTLVNSKSQPTHSTHNNFFITLIFCSSRQSMNEWDRLFK